jgi:hypothetical protein
MIKFFMPLLLLLISFTASANTCQLKKELDESQWSVVEYSYMRGLKHDMGYTLAAISFAESSAGKFRVNWKDPSFGAYHILIHTASKRLGVTESVDQVNLAVRLTHDDNVGATMALMELKYWHKRWDGDWTKTWASYNMGNNWSKGLPYAYKIKRIIGKLKGCFK